MAKYQITAMITISLSTEVEASSENEALFIARNRDLPRIIDQSNPNEEWSTSGELDGIPYDFNVIKIKE